jgi:hypothetical protein
MSSEQHPYLYQLIENEADAEYCARLLSEAFSNDNPLTRFQKMTAEGCYQLFMREATEQAMKEGLAFLVRHQPTGEIVATISGYDMYTSQQQHAYDPNAPAHEYPIPDLLDEMSADFIQHNLTEPLKPGQVLYVSVGATRLAHSGQGIAKQLRKVLCKHARDVFGFQKAFVIAGNDRTRHIYLRHLGGKELLVVTPNQWCWKKKGDDAFPFRSFTGNDFSNIVVDLVDADLG